MKIREMRRGGFTILELLVVIFIMMAMTGIAVAAFQQFMDTERIKLAGGQVVAAIRMARQYGMSRRAKVMVEFGPPRPTEKTDYSLTPADSARIQTGDGQADTALGGSWLRLACGYGTSVLLKYDISSIPTEGWIESAILKVTFDNSGGVTQKPQDLTIRLQDPAWDSTTVTYNNAPGTEGGDLVTEGGADVGDYEFNLTQAIAAKLAGDPAPTEISLRITAAGGYSWQYYGITVASATLEITRAEKLDHPEGTIRNVAIIPYIRSLDTTTGGFSWLLDRDANALKVMYLPRNIYYVLVPGEIAVDQYDPGDVIDGKSITVKSFFCLHPDGTASAQPPDVEGWTDRVNTVILRDMTVGDVCLLFMPPSSAFTRQRYLFGEEVDEFASAHSSHSLWD